MQSSLLLVLISFYLCLSRRWYLSLKTCHDISNNKLTLNYQNYHGSCLCSCSTYKPYPKSRTDCLPFFKRPCINKANSCCVYLVHYSKASHYILDIVYISTNQNCSLTPDIHSTICTRTQCQSSAKYSISSISSIYSFIFSLNYHPLRKLSPFSNGAWDFLLLILPQIFAIHSEYEACRSRSWGAHIKFIFEFCAYL